MKEESKSTRNKPRKTQKPVKQEKQEKQATPDKNIVVTRTGDCHYCQKEVSILESAQCCIRNCRKIYCEKCILANFDKEFELSKFCRPAWICYSCGERCKCKQCKSNTNKAKNNGMIMENQDKTNGNPRKKLKVEEKSNRSQSKKARGESENNMDEEDDEEAIPVSANKYLARKKKLHKVVA